MLVSHFLLASGWILFCALHSILASVGFKRRISARLGKKAPYFRLYYNLFALISFILVVVYALSISSTLIFSATAFSQFTGWSLTGIGLLIMIVSIARYFRSLSGIFIEEADQEARFLCDGLHRWVRHPLYLGTFIFIWGAWLLYPSWAFLISNLIITSYTLIGIRFEEKKLLALYGEAYHQYQQKVPMIVPAIF